MLNALQLGNATNLQPVCNVRMDFVDESHAAI